MCLGILTPIKHWDAKWSQKRNENGLYQCGVNSSHVELARDHKQMKNLEPQRDAKVETELTAIVKGEGEQTLDYQCRSHYLIYFFNFQPMLFYTTLKPPIFLKHSRI